METKFKIGDKVRLPTSGRSYGDTLAYHETKVFTTCKILNQPFAYVVRIEKSVGGSNGIIIGATMSQTQSAFPEDALTLYTPALTQEEEAEINRLFFSIFSLASHEQV